MRKKQPNIRSYVQRTQCIAAALHIALFGSIWAKNHQATQIKKIIQGSYQEELPLYPIHQEKPTHKRKKAASLTMALDQTEQLDALLLQRKRSSQAQGTLKGSTLQVYMGASKAKALRIQEKLRPLIFPCLPYLQYREPNYTVRFGFFPDKLEGYLTYLKLITSFPETILRPFSMKKMDYQQYVSSHRDA